MEKRTKRSQLILFVILSYSILWLLFGIGKLFGVSFTYDPGQVGGVLVLLGVPASLTGAIISVLIGGGKNGLRKLFKRSFGWRFRPLWYIASISTQLLITVASTITFFSMTKSLPGSPHPLIKGFVDAVCRQ